MTERQRFIYKISKYVIKYASAYGIKVHSPIIAQAILESNWGNSILASKYNNYFGLKCGTKWTGKSVNLRTQEEYRAGVFTKIKDDFRVYDSMEEGVKGYFEFIQLARYKNLKGITDPKSYVITIKNDGYATDSNYVSKIMNIINSYILTQYDVDVMEGKEMARVTPYMVIEDAVKFAVNMANNNRHGYSQIYRSLYNITSPTSFDCSSLVLTAYYYAFIKNGMKEQADYIRRNCSYTGNMINLLNVGFEVVARGQTAHSQMVRGDIELNTVYHTAMAIDRNNIVHARSSEGTRDTYDNSGNEIRIQPWYLYSHGWTHRLRFTGKGITMPVINGNGVETPNTSVGGVYMFGCNEVKKGSVGNHVLLMQEILKARGFKGKDGKELVLDKQAGDNSIYALTEYQKSRKGVLKVDGICGSATWKDLIAL